MNQKTVSIQKWHIATIFLVGAMLTYLAYAATAKAEVVNASTTVTVQISGSSTTGSKIKANMQKNQDARNIRLDERKDVRMEKKEDIKDLRASTTAEMRANQSERKDTRDRMRENVFKIRRDAIVKQFNISISNLKNIASRIQTRIDKIRAEGKDVSASIALLATANIKLTKAQADVAVVANMLPPMTTNASSTGEIDLAKPRLAAETAQKSIQDAREAIRKTVLSLPHPPENTHATSTSATTSSATSAN